MIKIKIYATMAAALLALAACTSDEETAQTDGTPQGAVIVKATIGSPLTRVNTEGDGGTFTPGDIIYVENLADGKVEGHDKGRYILQADGTTWQPCDEEGKVSASPSMQWGTTNRFRGVYPATAAEGFTLPTDQSTEKLLRSADYMTCEDTEQYAMPQGGAASLSFSHRMAKLTLRLTLNSQYTGSETIGDVKLYLADGTTAITPYPTETTADGAIVYTAILNPADYTDTSQPFCTVTVDGGTPLTARVPSGGITLEEGKAHTLNLRVGKNKIEMGGMTVNEWGSTVDLGDNVADKLPIVNTTTHTITTYAEGLIAEDPSLIAEAIGDGTTLIITGPMNDDDIAAIKTYLKDNPVTGLDLNLANAGITALPNNNEYLLPDYREWPGVKSIVLPEGLTTIGDFAFQKCPDLASITLPSTLKYIGFGAFAHCAGLTEVSLPASLEEFNMCAFYGCSGLTSIDLSHTQVGIISNGAFQNCTGLEEVILCSSVKTLDYYSFSGCTSLKTIDLSLCDEIPGRGWNSDSNYAFKDVDKTGITVYVKDAALKTAFEESFWVTHEGFTADNCKVKE